MNPTTEIMLQNQQMLINRVLNKRFKITGCIKKGKYGAVYKAKDLHNDKHSSVMIKIIYKHRIDWQFGYNKSLLDLKYTLINRQAHLMQTIKHNRVLPLIEHYQNKQYKIIVTKYCDGGTLTSQLLTNHRLSKQRVLNVIKQIGSAIETMHLMKQVHTMLSTDCVYFHEGRSYLGDFGINYVMFGDQSAQLLQPTGFNYHKISSKVDLYSIGILLYTMMGQQKNIKEKIKICKTIPEPGNKNALNLTPQINLFITKCLKSSMTWKELRNNVIFKKPQNLSNSTLPCQLFEQYTFAQLKKQQIDSLRIIDQNKRILDNLQKQGSKDINCSQQMEVSQQIQSQQLNKQSQTNKIYRQQKQLHLITAKCHYIRTKIIKYIQQLHLFQSQQRQGLQILYMLKSRLKIDLSNYNACITKLKISQPELYNQLIKTSSYKLFTQEFNKCTKKFDLISSQLTKFENKLVNIFTDKFFKIFKSAGSQYKDKLMNGIEGLQYKRQQHIEWVDKILKQSAVNQMRMYESKINQNSNQENLQYFKDKPKQIAHIWLYHRFMIYSDIINLTSEKLGHLSFQRYIQKKLQNIKFSQKIAWLDWIRT